MQQISDTLTFALLHSLWQGLLVFAGLRFVFLFIPERKSRQRYVAVTSAFLVFALISLGTLAVNFAERPASGYAFTLEDLSTDELTPFAVAPATLWQEAKSFVSTNSDVLAAVWAVGAFVFLLRAFGGFLYLRGIIQHGRRIVEIQPILDSLKERLGIRRIVKILESDAVTVPLVTGLIKPVIILPLGMSTGLTTAQIESVLIHELFHIKRYDYLLNVVQAIVESLFFFNPFVWVLSEMMRREREHCCDDAVIAAGIDNRTYALTLATLEEIRHSKSGLALSLAGTKYALLHRIKRLMEKSAHTYSAREKFIPVILLVVGFACASWFTISPATRNAIVAKVDLQENNDVPADTIPQRSKDKKRELRESTKANDPDHTEEYEEHFDVHPEVGDFHFPDIDIPEIPDIDVPQFDFAEPGFPAPLMDEAFQERWQEFAQQFNSEFSERFGEFFNKNQEEIRQMMEELREKNSALFERRFDNQFQMLELQDKALAIQEEVLAKHSQEMEKFSEKMQEWELKNREQFRKIEDGMQKFQLRMEEFQVALKKELVADGYLKEGEHIRQFHWDNDNVLRVNGKEIPEKDRKKYDDLRKKYVGKDANVEYKKNE